MAELNSSPEKSGGKVARKRLNARVDLTAMVDLAFLLITFFMLTTSLQKPKMFGVTMPDDEPTKMKVKASETMTICLGKNNQVLSYLGLPDAPLTEPKVTGDGNNGILPVVIETKKRVEATGHPLFVIIKASDHAVYANMVNVLDELNIAGGPTYAITDIQLNDIAMLKQHNAY